MRDPAPNVLVELLERLKVAFPVAIDVDYIDLLGLDRFASLITAENKAAFRKLSAAILVLIDEKVVKADRLEHEQDVYFWNLRLTAQGYARLRQDEDILEALDPRDVLVAFMQRS